MRLCDERLIADARISDRVKQEALLALGARGLRGERRAIRALKNILACVPGVQTAGLLKDASVRAFAAGTLEDLRPLMRVLGNLCVDRRTSGEIQAEAFCLLADLIRKQGHQVADRELERILPVIEKLISDPDIPEDEKNGWSRGLSHAVAINLESAQQTAERLLPVWVQVIIGPRAPRGLRYDALMITGCLFWKDRPPAIRTFKQILPALVKFITARRTSTPVLYAALTLLRVAVFRKNPSAVQASRQLVPAMEEAVRTAQTPDDLKNLFGMFLGCVACAGIEGVLGSLARLIADPRVSGEVKNLLLFHLGETICPGDGLLPENFKIRNAALSPQTVRGIVGMLEVLFSGAGLNRRVQPEGLRVLLYLIQRDSGRALRLAGNLAPFLERLVFNPSAPDQLRRLAVRTSGWAAAKGVQSVMPLLSRGLRVLKQAGADASWSDGLKEELRDALGQGLPLAIKGPAIKLRQGSYPEISLKEILARGESPRNPRFVARSLIHDVGENDVLAIKFLRDGENPSALLREAFWIKYLEGLKGRGYFKETRFELPRLQEFSGSRVIRLKNIPANHPRGLHPERYALCFVASKDYYAYPNEILPGKTLSQNTFREVISRGAYLLGALAARGIIHTDVIPLFHTVLTSHSRVDRGMHMWWYRGGVHQWIQSCDYPNLGPTGLRDFEHFLSWGRDPVPFRYHKRPRLYYLIGTHFLSLFLLVGSYVRNKDRAMVGLDRQGDAFDVRHLFDKTFLEGALKDIFLHYYRGFAGEEAGRDGVAAEGLLAQAAEEMIAEMGVDRSTVVGLLVRDQTKMSAAACRNLLRASGYSAKELGAFEKGRRNMMIFHGPNLFAAPAGERKMYAAIAALAAHCVAKRFEGERDA